MVDLGSRTLATAYLEGTHKWRVIVLAGIATLLSLVLARLVLVADLAVPGVFVALVGITAVLIRPRYGVYFLLAITLFFDIQGKDPIMLPSLYLSRSVQETLRIPGAIFFPIEALVLIIFAAWLARGLMLHRLDFRDGTLGRPMLLFGLAVVFGLVRGLLAGGIFNYAFWESRFLIAMVLTFILAANTIRTKGHVRTILLLVFVCVGLSAVEGIWRRFALADAGLLGPAQETWYSHDDVVMWGLLFMLVLTQQVFGGPRWQRILGPIAAISVLVAMVVSERRAGYFCVIVALIAFAITLFVVKRKAFVLLIVPLLIGTMVYLPLFWNNAGMLGQPARAIRSVVGTPDERDAESNAWRALEAINVRATIAAYPLEGVGFGRPFLQVVAVPDISFFEFWNYESHHDILWVWMKTGAFGFIAFFALLTLALARGSWLVTKLRDPTLRNFAVVCTSAVLLSATYCYVDLGLTSSRVPILLGLLLGVLSVLHRIADRGDTTDDSDIPELSA